ncbi:MAG TPA: hypothetical protein VIL03_06630 [Clostridia bacterium]|jgi:hypothetical protein
MGYAKKILILNEVTKGFGIGDVKGVATIEKIGDRAKCAIEIFNLKDISKGIFAFGVASDSSPVYTQRLGAKGKISASMPLGEINLNGNLYCVLCYISDENIIPIAWGANNAKKLWETNILDGFKHIIRPAMFAGAVEKVEKDFVAKPKPQEHSFSSIPKNTSQPNTPPYQSYQSRPVFKDNFFDKPLSVPKITVAKVSKVIDEAEREYNDSSIAQNSYYPQDIKPRDILQESAAAAQAVQDAMSRPGFYKAFEQTPQELVDGYDEQTYIKNNFSSKSFYQKSEPQQEMPRHERPDDLFNVYYYQEEEQESEPTYIKSWGGYNNIKTSHKEQKIEKDQVQESNGQPKYYLSVKDQLEKLFENNPPEEKLNSLMPDTYWVRVEIGPNQYYVVGLIGEGPDYIGYGVPGAYSVNPPKELQGYCKWLALDKNNPKGEGYWMMYQDAESGQSINLDLV